jgi:hypothetical protein
MPAIQSLPVEDGGDAAHKQQACQEYRHKQHDRDIREQRVEIEVHTTYDEKDRHKETKTKRL